MELWGLGGDAVFGQDLLDELRRVDGPSYCELGPTILAGVDFDAKNAAEQLSPRVLALLPAGNGRQGQEELSIDSTIDVWWHGHDKGADLCFGNRRHPRRQLSGDEVSDHVPAYAFGDDELRRVNEAE
jgi:hypothetical protein